MKISWNWLRQYIAIPVTAEEAGKMLTSTGLEVESIELKETVRGGLQGLVIGEVITCAKHPNADKLSVTTVDVGGSELSRIVCGASNVAAGLKVIVAVPGATIFPTKGEPFTIKSAKIRGEISEGMICAEDEIGLGDSHEGIIILNTTLANGTPASEFFQVSSDEVIEIGLTPNRADAASHIGVARDLKALKNYPLTWPSVEQFKKDAATLPIEVTVEAEGACPRYSGLTIDHVTVGESPAWLKTRLQSIGLSPINNIVDITNFVLHETGQPLHAFDYDSITGKKVIVKTLPEGTRFRALDDKERVLTATDLMICNASEGMCIAGVFGGKESGIKPGTTRIFLESAYFLPASVRKTSMHHQLKTDASFRFERGTDPELTVYALKRAALLIKEVAGGEIASDVIDIYPKPIAHHSIVIKQAHVRRLIGKDIPREEIFGILERLDISITEKSEEVFVVSVPPYRVDVKHEADVIEEILRIYGLDNILLSPVSGTDYLSQFPKKDINGFRRTIGGMLVANGFYEILTNSLTNPAYQQKHNLAFNGETVEILNKLSEEQGILRQTMLFTGLEVCSHNINRRQKDLKLYEFGKIYWKDKEASRYVEQERLAIYVTGNAEAESWQHKTKPVSYFDLAQHVVHVLDKCGVKNFEQEKLDDPIFEYGMKIKTRKGEIGKIGKVKSAFAKDFGIRQDIFYADLDAALLFSLANPKFDVMEVSKFPEVRRDLSVVIDKSISFSEIKTLVLATEKKLIKDIVAFDVYEGDKIPQGKKAYALGFTLLDETKTLTDGEIDSAMNNLIGAFETKMGALIRK